MNPHEDTVFDKVIRREIPAEIVYEDEDTLAFFSINPSNPGHTLVIPKKFARNIFDMDESTLVSVAKTVKKVAIAIKEATGAEGMNIAMNNEHEAGQVVFYAHVHVIPRFNDDGHKHFPQEEYDAEKSALIADNIRAQFNS